MADEAVQDFTSSDDGIVDFTPPVKLVQFRIAPDVFQGVSDLPALVAMQFAVKVDKFTDVDESQMETMIAEMFEMILEPASAALFISRLKDVRKPIGASTMFKLLPWLMEQYGMRPTEPSSSSSDGSSSQGSGPSSTVVLPGTELTSGPSH